MYGSAMNSRTGSTAVDLDNKYRVSQWPCVVQIHSLLPMEAKFSPCLYHHEEGINVSGNNYVNKNSNDIALNVTHTRASCALANCEFACTNGSSSNNYGYISLQPVSAWLILG